MILSKLLYKLCQAQVSCLLAHIQGILLILVSHQGIRLQHGSPCVFTAEVSGICDLTAPCLVLLEDNLFMDQALKCIHIHKLFLINIPILILITL